MLASFRQQRAAAEVTRRRHSEATYREPLHIMSTNDKAAFQDFLRDFYRKIYQQRNELAAHLQATPIMASHYQKLVNETRQVSYEDFWQRYFWRCNIERVLAEWDAKDAQRAAARAQAMAQGKAKLQQLLTEQVKVVTATMTTASATAGTSSTSSSNNSKNTPKSPSEAMKDDEAIINDGDSLEEAVVFHSDGKDNASDNIIIATKDEKKVTDGSVGPQPQKARVTATESLAKEALPASLLEASHDKKKKKKKKPKTNEPTNRAAAAAAAIMPQVTSVQETVGVLVTVPSAQSNAPAQDDKPRTHQQRTTNQETTVTSELSLTTNQPLSDQVQKDDVVITETTETPSAADVAVASKSSPSVVPPPRSASTPVSSTPAPTPVPKADEPLILDLSTSSSANDALFRTWRHDENNDFFEKEKEETVAELVVDTTVQHTGVLEEKDTALHKSPVVIDEPPSRSSNTNLPDASNKTVAPSEPKVASQTNESGLPTTTSPKHRFVRMPVAAAAAAIVATVTVFVALLAVFLSLPAVRNGLCAPVPPWGTNLVELYHEYSDAAEKASIVVLSSPWWAPNAFKSQAHAFVCDSKRIALELQLESDNNNNNKKKRKAKDNSYRMMWLRMLAFEKSREGYAPGDDAPLKQQLLWEKRRLLSAHVYADHLSIITLNRKQQHVQEDISAPWFDFQK